MFPVTATLPVPLAVKFMLPLATLLLMVVPSKNKLPIEVLPGKVVVPINPTYL